MTALAAASPGRAVAQTEPIDQPPPQPEPADRPQDRTTSSKRTPPPGSAPRSVTIEGELLDAKKNLRRALGLDNKKPPSREQLLRYLDALGYSAQVSGDDTALTVVLKPFRVIRKIFIKGNWPIFEEEILKRLRFRPGQRLPEGADLELAIDRQEERVQRFLSREGYYDGHLRIWVKPTSVAHQVNLEVRLLKGRRYKVGEVQVVQVGQTLRPGELPDRPRKRATKDRAKAADGASRDPAEERIRAERRARRQAARQGKSGKRQRRAPGLAIPEKDIKKMFLQKILFYKRAFSTDRLKEDVKDLVGKFHARQYPGVRVRKAYEVRRDKPPAEAVKVTLKIQQRKRIVVRYFGNNRVEASELNKALTLYDEGTYDDYELAQSARKLHRLYQGKGYLQARIHFTRKVGRYRDRVTFHISEGPRYRIEDVLFVGNRSLTAENLRGVIKTKPFPLLGWIGLAEGGYVTDLQLAQDVERLEKTYIEQGFPDIKVSAQLAPHPRLLGHPGALAAALSDRALQKGDLYVRFAISEGERLLVESVRLNHGKVLKDAQLLSGLSLAKGRPFAEKTLLLDKARLVRIFSEQGYPYATVSSMEEVDNEGTRVTVHLTVQEGPAVRFGAVFVRGNFHTRRSVINSDIEFSPGDPFDIRKIEQTERLLRKREIFNMVRVQPLGMTDRRTELPVVVQVEERYDNYGTLELAVGGSTDNKLYGAVAYRNDNLFGFGTQISLKGEYGWEIWSGNVNYRDPRLFGSRFILDIKGFARNQDTERLGEILTFGGSVGLSREFVGVPGLTGLVRYEIRRTKHKEELYRPPGVDELSLIDVFTRVAGFGLTMVYDRRDSQINPTKGFRVAGSVFGASRYFGGSNHFLKFNVNGQGFLPLPKGMTIAANIKYDHGLPLSSRQVMLPKVERFYAGGDTTIRGLEEDMAFVERFAMAAPPLVGAELLRVRPQGANIRLVTNVEFQFPIWPESILFGWPIMGAVFFDNGFLTNSFEGFEWDRFRHGVGAALRLVTIVGFASVAYAFCLDPQPWDPAWGRFHFNFGYIF